MIYNSWEEGKKFCHPPKFRNLMLTMTLNLANTNKLLR